MRILVLGGASEIGLAIVSELICDTTGDVVMAGRSQSAHREQAISAIAASGSRSVEWVDFDACASEEHPALFDRIFTAPVDIAIVAFGILDGPQTWKDHLKTVRLAQTNYVGALSVGALLAQKMSLQGYGQIVALSSVAGERPRKSNFVYGSSKAGLDGYYLQLGAVLKPAGVKVLVVRPGAVQGRMTAGRQRVMMSVSPQHVAKATVRAMERGKSMIRVPAAFGPIMALYRNLPAAVASRLF